jgi:hypothetical protein
MRNLGLTNFRRPKYVICAGEITFRAVAYEEKNGMYIHVLTMGDIINVYRIFIETCSVTTLGEKRKKIEVFMIICILECTMEILLLKVFEDGIC